MNLTVKWILFLAVLLPFFYSSAWASGAEAPFPDEAGLYLNGTAFSDENADGVFSSGEATLTNVTIRLMHESQEASVAKTDERGGYLFADLSPGLYRLEADPISRGDLTSPGGGYYEVNLSDKPGFGLDFGFFVSSNLTASRPEKVHGIMRPTQDQIELWTGQYDAAPKAFLSSEIDAKMKALPPSSYSLLGLLKHTPSERDQGTCGNCWIWAGTGVMEIDYARQMGISDRFSIQYMDSSYNEKAADDGACCGGWLEDLAGFYNKSGVVIPWSNANANYRDGANGCGESPAVSVSRISTDPHYGLSSVSVAAVPTHEMDKEKAIDNIKNVLLQDRAIWFGFFLPDKSSWNDFYSFWSSKPESAVWKPDSACGKAYDYNDGGGHAVLCVGYDESDPQNRCWIMLNSWGTTAGRPSGLFRVSMDMDYDCSYPDAGYAFYWMSLNISYDKENNPPEKPKTPSGQTKGSVGQPLTYTTSAVDPDGDYVRITFNWKDGTTTQTKPSSDGTGTASHTWKKAGKYLVTAMATDSAGATSPWSDGLSVDIAGANGLPSRPSVPLGPVSGSPGMDLAFSSSSIDPDGDDVQLTFDWGDKSQSSTEFAKSGSSISASHAWTRTGTYFVRAKATDKRGGQSDWSYYLKVSIIKNTPPNNPRQPVGVSRGFVGKSYSFISVGTDPDKNKIAYTFDWGDGEKTTTAFLTSGVSARVAHVWKEAGEYRVRVLATDSIGASSKWSASKTVTIKSSIQRMNSGQRTGLADEPGKSGCPCNKD